MTGIQPLSERLLQALREPEAAAIADLDGPEAAVAFRRLIRRKPLLRALYHDFYAQLLAASDERRPLIEVGSGSGFLREMCPEAIVGDILPAPDLDLRFSGLDLPFRDHSVGGFVMFDVFHHVPNAELFLEEMHRCLRMSGRIVMIEPAVTTFSRIIYGNFHHEPFDPAASDWHFLPGGARSTSNMALPWIVFVRDKERFSREFPGLAIVDIRVHTPLRYLLSGGLSLRQILPGRMNGLILAVEKLLRPFHDHLGLFMTVTLEKCPETT
ncbi:MAG: methyltransferase domain-containing protein [Candidatus Ozemobacteraceae bacterium]